MLLLLLTMPRPDGYLWAQDCATSEPISTPSIFDLTCNDMGPISLQTNADRFAPLLTDDLKIVRLRFVFLQRPGDEATGIGGFHLSNPKHLKYWSEVVNYMNWVLTDDLHLTANGPNQCEGADNDTRIRFDVEMVNMADEYYWNNLNNAGFPSGICDNCPRDNSWYLNPLQQELYNNEGCEHRINIFFTERADVYQQAINIPLNSEGLPTDPIDAFDIFDSVCNTDCSLLPTAFADDGDGLELRVHMLDEYNSYIAQKLCLRSNNSSYDCDPATYWNDEDDAFIINDWADNRYIWQVGSTARLILHELGHSFGLLHTDDSTWPFLNTECNLMCGNDDTRNQIYGAQQKAVHKAFSTLNCERYIKDCPYSPNHPIEITGTETWTNEIRLYSDLIVRTGAKLTVKCIVHMPPNGRIVVERGAKLIVDGGIITDTNCECERWQGIEVWGNTTTTGRSHQQVFNNVVADLLIADDYTNVTLLPDDPGMVVLINEAKIENGPNGAISTKKRSEGWNEAFWGGIVYANNTTFDNNKRAVEFMRYVPTNYSRFIGCTFTVKDDYPFTTWQGVTMWATNDVQFRRCIFSHTLPNRRGEGVGGLDAAFTVRDNCMFQNLDKGIDAEATMPLSGNVVIGSNNAAQGNSFDNNTKHVRAKSIDKLDVENNTFGLTAVQSNFGILASNGTQGLVSNNTFTNTINGIVSISNPRGTFNLRCNDFYNNELAIWALGDNRSIIFNANEFFNTTKFDAVLSSVGTEQGDWRDAHGSLTEPRFNLFSSNLSQDHIATINFFSGVQTLFFNYYHPTPTLNSRLMPVCDDEDDCTTPNNYHNQDVGEVPLSQIPNCIDINGLIGGGGGDEFCQSKECLENLKVYINDLKNNIDGGDKEQLIADLSAYPNSAATFQSLYDGSPYLSDSILLQIAQATGMADWKRSNLLVINSPLSDEVMTQIIDYVPTYTYQILESIRYYDQLSERGVLESRISEEERKKAAILSTLLTEMLQQKNYAEMVDLVADEEPEYALRTLSAAQLHLGNPTQAQTILDQIPIFDAEDQQFYDIQSINIQRATQAQFDLSPEQEAAVRQIANDYYSTQAGYAQGLLRLYRDEQIDIVLPDIEDGTHTATSGKTNAAAHKARFSTDELNSLMLFPNPAASVATFYLPITGDNSTLEVRDTQGNSKASEMLTPGQRVGQLDVSDLPNGLYWVSLQDGNKTISSAKLIVVH